MHIFVKQAFTQVWDFGPLWMKMVRLSAEGFRKFGLLYPAARKQKVALCFKHTALGVPASRQHWIRIAS